MLKKLELGPLLPSIVQLQQWKGFQLDDILNFKIGSILQGVMFYKDSSAEELVNAVVIWVEARLDLISAKEIIPTGILKLIMTHHILTWVSFYFLHPYIEHILMSSIWRGTV